MPRRIFGSGAQFLQVCAADLRIAFLEPFFVGDRCLLNKFDIGRAAPPFIPVQERFVGAASDDLMQDVRNLHRIVNAAVQSQPANGIVDVRRVTREKYPSLTKLRSNPLMCLIQVAMDETIRSGFWKCALNAAVNGFIAQRMLVGFIDLRRKAGAPPICGPIAELTSG